MRHHSAPLLRAQSRRISGERVSTPASSDVAVSTARPQGAAAKAVNFQRVLSRSSSQMTVGGGAGGGSSALAGRPVGAEVVM
jgi:hypothetical protein